MDHPKGADGLGQVVGSNIMTRPSTGIKRKLIVETDGPLPEFIIDKILDTINKKVFLQKLQFLSARRSPTGNIILQTYLTTSATQEATHLMEITTTLDNMMIEVQSIRDDRKWTRFILHDMSAHICTNNTTKTCTKMIEEMIKATNLVMARSL
ncbi:hypothetical protein Q9L58_009708 [Maublancomyces gigas]|uniref:Uncharacterized protein n=1 Tax=Discina gigas TaxID=1032678 RepID=A0ABR3G6D8_9PEZI